MELAFLDIEATGPNPYRSRILEISIILTDENLVQREIFSTLIKPQERISRSSYDIHGISERDLIDAPRFPEISGRIRKMLENRILIGYRVWDFDIKLLNIEFARNGTLTLFPDFIDLKDVEEIPSKKSLFHMARSLNIRTGRLHRATPDARTTLKIMRKIKDRTGWNQLMKYLRKPSKHPKVLKIIENTNRGYLSNIIYRSRYNISEHTGFPILIDGDYLLFKNIYVSRNFRLYAQRIIKVEKLK